MLKIYIERPHLENLTHEYEQGQGKGMNIDLDMDNLNGQFTKKLNH
jgi:hypothetical protein